MSILDTLKTDLILFLKPNKSSLDESRKNNNLSDILGQNGLSDEEWEAKKREHPGLFARPCTNHVTKTHKEGNLSDILGQNGLSDEEWEAKKREHPGLFGLPYKNE